LIAIAVASFANLVENLIEAGNILGSVFYGSILGLFLAAFFIRGVKGSAVFFAALIAQSLVFVLFATTSIGYLWYNFIGCAAVLILAPFATANYLSRHRGCRQGVILIRAMDHPIICFGQQPVRIFSQAVSVR
jgi:hypothetical protein